MASLKERLEIVNRTAGEHLPRELRDAFEVLIGRLKACELTALSLKAGDRIPDFMLPNTEGRLVSSAELLARGPLVLSFFRGAWCAYCTEELQALEEIRGEIERLGASLVAITPDTGGAIAAAKRDNQLSFDVLSDADNGLALQFGLVYRLPEAARPHFVALGVDLAVRHGNDAWLLPVPATYVVDAHGIIRRAELDVDFRSRMEPADILAELRRIRAEPAAASGEGGEIARPDQPDEGVERG
jgi:peroxiredoxin